MSFDKLDKYVKLLLVSAFNNMTEIGWHCCFRRDLLCSRLPYLMWLGSDTTIQWIDIDVTFILMSRESNYNCDQYDKNSKYEKSSKHLDIWQLLDSRITFGCFDMSCGDGGVFALF